ncbi:MAG: type IV pilus biogenesis/stability protein PilW [Pseudomonadota bacterium]
MKYSRTIVLLCAVLGGCVTEGDVSRRNVKESPNDAAAYNYQLGVEYLRAGKLRPARERLESSIRQNPSVATTHFTLAILYQRLDEPQLADRSFRNAIKIAPDDAAVQNSYAVHLCGQKQFKKAERYFVDAATNPIYGTPAAAWTNAGVCMLDKPDDASAERYFRRALEVDRQFASALLELAVLKFDQNNALSARAFLQRFFAAHDATAQTLLLAARVEERLADDTAFAEFSQRLQDEFPDSAEARQLRRGY